MSREGDIEFMEEKQKVLVGKEGWLFLQNDTNQIVEQNIGKVRLSDDGCRKWGHIIDTRFSLLNRHGKDYYFCIAPNKESIYSEFLPEGYHLIKDRPVYFLQQELKRREIKLINPEKVLRLYKNQVQVYPKTNTHWNELGAFIGYQYLIDNILQKHKVKKLGWEDVAWENIVVSADLGDKMNPPVYSDYIKGKIKSPQAQIVFDNQKQNTGRIQISQNKEAMLPRAIVFHDSFSEMLFHYLIESFSEVYFLHSPSLMFELIDEFDPDIVISQMAERFLIQIPNDHY